MSTVLPLYEEYTCSPLETSEGKVADKYCTKCNLSGYPLYSEHLEGTSFRSTIIEGKGRKKEISYKITEGYKRVSTVCIPPMGEPSGLLLVSEKPTLNDDSVGRPYASSSGIFLKKLVDQFWKGPVAHDFAIKCAPCGGNRFKGTPCSLKHADACLPYLKKTIDIVQPNRILAFGSIAIYALLGRSPAPGSVRRGYGWLTKGNKSIPVFLFPSPEDIMRNKFLRKRFIKDIEWVTKVDVDALYLKNMLIWDSVAYEVNTPAEAQQCYNTLKKDTWVAWDVETAGKMFRKDFKVLCIGMSGKEAEDSWIWTEKALKDPDCLVILKQMMEDPTLKKVEQNGKFDRLALDAAFGIKTRGVYFDTLYARKLLESDCKASLDIQQELVGLGGGKEESRKAILAAVSSARKKNATEEELKALGPLEHVMPVRFPSQTEDEYKAHVFALIPKKILHTYCCRDSRSTSKIAEILEKRINNAKDVSNAWHNLVLPAAEELVQVESWGVAVSQDTIDAFSSMLLLQRQEIMGRLLQYGKDFNPASSQQVANLLFKEIGLKPIKTTKGGNWCVDNKVLTALKGQHPVIEDLLKLHAIDKQYGTYAEGMKRHIRMDGRIHPSFNLSGARSGRMSCRDPNLQNISRGDTPESKMARDIFVAEGDNVIISLDYSQLELRVATMLSQDPEMLKLWLSGEDYHTATAKLIAKPAWNISPEEWETLTKEEKKKYRSASKCINFGLLYGMTDGGLAVRLNCSKAEAKFLREQILGAFSKLAAWIQEQIRTVEETGYIWTQWDGRLARRRELLSIDTNDDLTKFKARNAAVNTPVQGLASDFCLKSLSTLVRWIKATKFPAKLICTVHDSLMFETHPKYKDELIGKAREVMTSYNTNGVPLVVDADEGRTWGSLEEYKG